MIGKKSMLFEIAIAEEREKSAKFGFEKCMYFDAISGHMTDLLKPSNELRHFSYAYQAPSESLSFQRPFVF